MSLPIDPDVLLAMSPEELGLASLSKIAGMAQSNSGRIQFMGFHGQVCADYPSRPNEAIVEALAEAWAWLEGQGFLFADPNQIFNSPIRKLSRQARLIALTDAKDWSAFRLERTAIHQSIRDKVWSEFHRGNFDVAVFLAMKQVEVAVSEASGLKAEIGVKLMRKAFDKATGPLRNETMEEGERDARAHLFAGVIGSYKNPQSHRNVNIDDAREAAELIVMASHLLRIVDGIVAEKMLSTDFTKVSR